MDHSLPISILSFITALIPMMILLVLLVFKQMPPLKQVHCRSFLP